MSDTSDNSNQSEATSVAPHHTIQSGAKLSIVSLDHDDPTCTPSDSLLDLRNGSEIIEVFQALISDDEVLEMFNRGMESELRRQGRKKISYAERKLISLAERYLAVTKYLNKEHGIQVPGEEYSAWKIKLQDQSTDYMLASQYGLARNAEYSPFATPAISDESLNLADLPILAAIVVLQSILHIARIIDISVRENVAPLTLDSALQLSELYAFCESSYALLNIEDMKERGWREIQARNRRDAAASVRIQIRNRLKALLSTPGKERFRYKDGKRRGRLKVEYIVGSLQKDFESDRTWKKNVPGKTVLREEIRGFEEAQK